MHGEELIRRIAQLSVDTVNEVRGKYPDELLQAYSLVGKYLTIAVLDKSIRQHIGHVTTEEMCPLCHIYIKDKCEGCVLKEPRMTGCGNQYDGVKQAIKEGSFLDVAFNIARLVRLALKPLLEEESND